MLTATDEALARAVPDRPDALAHIVAIREGLMHALRAQVLEAPVLSTSRAVIEYLFAAMGYLPIEQIRVLYLDAGNRLIADEILSHGTARETAVPAREIVGQAIAHNATALILAHNHPSGRLEPSRADISATNRLARLGRDLGIRLHDHLIVARTGVASLRALGLLEGMPGGA